MFVTDAVCSDAVLTVFVTRTDVLLEQSFPELEYLKFSAKRFHPLSFIPHRQLQLKKFKFSQKFPHEGDILEMFGRMLSAGIFEFSISASPAHFNYARVAQAFGRDSMEHLVVRSTSIVPLQAWLRPATETAPPIVAKLDVTFTQMQDDIITTLPVSVTNLGLRLESADETLLFYDLMVKMRERDWMPNLRVLRITAKSFTPPVMKAMSLPEKRQFAAAMQGCHSAAESRGIAFQLYINSSDRLTYFNA